tara:strand:- start:111 stop:743 length:633 start_codon:yes stop_codon:yes gene_type:complete
LSINFDQLKKINSELVKYKSSSLLIVTKNRDTNTILKLIKNGYKKFGENKVQEANEKFSIINDSSLNLHLIGPLQTNKVKLALEVFDTIQSIDRIKLVKEIAKHLSKKIRLRTRDFYIQVNIGMEDQKSGVMPEQLKYLYETSLNSKLNISGLMCIPPLFQDPNIYFEKMNNLKNSIDKDLKLSMGMSNDYEIALRHNSNLIRVGSKIFE